ncbi:MAG: LTA synthase family protein [Oscillospiraceae bacterium]|nr:LTA synthase family protein [Oscillospiraceae bacterium]
MNKIKRKKILWGCLAAVTGILLLVVCRWYSENFYSEFEEVFVTVTSPLQGTDTTAVKNGLRACFLPVFIPSALFIGAAVLCEKLHIARRVSAFFACRGRTFDAVRFFGSTFLYTGIALLAAGLVYANSIFHATEYISLKLQATDIYEQHYADPDSVAITPAGEKRNLIYLYIESLETTYASRDKGGMMDENYIPFLTQLAEEETNFSENGMPGGFHNTSGSTWTSGALFSSTAGMPYYTRFKQADGEFASDATTLYDILDKEGYSQYFICGSDAYFGGRSDYYKSHGDLTIYDLNTARQEGYVAEDYRVWWGIEDAKMYEMAKDKLLLAAEKDEPFSFTMLTVDTHFPKGYTCQLCGNEYENTSANVIKCADSQVADFINWCREQDFYKDTVIVVAGDHRRMDKVFPVDMTSYDRSVYLTFVNSAVKQDKSADRIYTQLDIMPTTLAAMGYVIEGDRLALGTNLFSDVPTLAESMGFEQLNAEMGKRTDYVDNFT